MHYPDLRIVKFLYLLDVILPLIMELESTSLVPADPILELFTTEVYDEDVSPVAWFICIKHWDRRFRLSLSFLLFGKSPLEDPTMDEGGGGRGGGL